MSDQLPEESSELAQVLNRINALMQKGDAPLVDTPHEEPYEDIPATSATDEFIPLLTEVYQGPPVSFTAQWSEALPLSQEESEQAAVNESPVGKVRMDTIDTLMMEMTPLVQTTIKETVQLEMVKLEQVLATRLETELMHTLRKRLRSLIKR